MAVSFRLCEVTEGAARLRVPDVPRRKGPGTVGPWPFYNPTMAVSRDLSAVLLAAWPTPLQSALDGLAATGVWGIRMALEGRVRGLTLNDRSPEASRLARDNADRNGVDATVITGDLRAMLRSASYGFVDIDPFGSPTPYLEAALESAQSESGLGVTATDTAVLCGTYPVACQRRYGARPLRCDQGAEVGLRILLGYCAQLAADRGKRIEPVLSFGAAHFLRVFLVVRPGGGSAPIGWVERMAAGEFRPTVDSGRGVGPLWLGPLFDPDLVGRLTPSSFTRPAAVRLLLTIQGEVGLPPFFVTTDELAAAMRVSPPRMDPFLGRLRAMGYRAARTHLHPRGVRTDAPARDLLRAFRAQAPSGSKDGSGPAS